MHKQSIPGRLSPPMWPGYEAKMASDTCPLCHVDSQNLVHILNLCQVALNLRRYNDRHDSVLTVLYKTIHSTFRSLSLALWIWPTFPLPTSCQPISDLVELTLCYDTLFHEAETRKTNTWTSSLLFAMQGTTHSQGGIMRPPQHVWF